MDTVAEFRWFEAKIRVVFMDDLNRMSSIPEHAIDQILENHPFGYLTHEALEVIRRSLEFEFSVRQESGHTVKSDYKPWLKQRDDIDFYYWNRLRKYYLGEGELPNAVVSKLHEVTNEVLDYCGNPLDEGSWKRRGMVMGHVQSGKTTNYASLICKAADSGYKIIILLAGLTNSLRTQTQGRIDETFIGKKSLFGQRNPALMPLMSYCGQKRIHPAFGTTRDSDFNNQMATQFGVSLANLSDPIIFVTKKNRSILENLFEWISSQRQDNREIEYPLLLIDDEADNASVNTAKDGSRSSAINDVIRRILTQFSRSTYVGYTATPFANIFIDPDTEDEMCGHDLFPRHFIKALDPPSNYIGATRIFSSDGDLRSTMLRMVSDYKDILPLKHKKDLELCELPPSLLEAIRAFILVRAIRTLRNDGNRHCSMMINVSRFNDVQEKVEGLVFEYQKRLDDAIRVNAGLGAEGLRDPDLASLNETFYKEYSDTEFEFDDLLKVLREASRTISVVTVNMRGGKLDYESSQENGLHVIAIGGLALSRGLTLEGLAVSYLLRNAAASDTLMQMARWFGYRRNYEELCRLYICDSAVQHYEYIEDAVEELRAELKRMEVREETPEQFGLRVRRSETGIMITAANKMRNATRMQLAESFDSKHVEGFALPNDAEINEQNLKSVFGFVDLMGQALEADRNTNKAIRSDVAKHFVWRNVDGALILKLLGDFSFHANQPSLAKIDGRNSLFSDYVRDRLSSELSHWDVAIPLKNGVKPKSFSIDDLPNYRNWPLRSRNSGSVRLLDDGVSAFKPTGNRNRIADPNEDAPMLLSTPQLERARNLKEQGEFRGDRVFCAVRERPLMLIHLFTVEPEDDELRRNLKIHGRPVVSLSFCMPGTGIPVQPRDYQVNAVYRRQLEMLAAEEDDDEQELGNG